MTLMDREEENNNNDTTPNVDIYSEDNDINNSYNEEYVAKVWRLISDTAFSGFQDESFLVCNSNVIRDQVSQWKSSYPFATPTFDLSINSNPYVIQTLSSLDCVFVCRNKNDLESALENGVKNENIFFQHEILVPSHLKFAHANNIGNIVFRNDSDLKKILKYAPNASLMLAFDVNENEDKVVHLLENALKSGKKVTGISVRGRKLDDDDNNKIEVNSVAKINSVLQKGKQMGHFQQQSKSHLDLGTIKVNEVSELKQILKRESVLEEFQVTLDSGNQLVNSAFFLAARILRKRRFFDDIQEGETKFSYVLNDGVFASFGHLMLEDEDEENKEGSDLKPEPLIIDEDVKNLKSDLRGPSGDDLDVIGLDFQLPEMQVGDWVVFPNAGCFSMGKHRHFLVDPVSEHDPELRLFYKQDEDEDDYRSEIQLNAGANNNNNRDFGSFSFDDLLPEMMSSYSPPQ